MIILLVLMELFAITVVTRFIDIAPAVVLTLILWGIIYALRAEKRGDL